MKTEKDFHPGWTITPAQYGRYWRLMSDCANKLHLTINETREMIHLRAFGEPRSAKQINHTTDFDQLEKEWAVILKSDQIQPQLDKQNQPNIRIIHLIEHEYLARLAILLPIKYGHVTLPLSDRARNKCPNFYLAEKYLKTILENRFKTDNIRNLDTTQRPSSTGAKLSDLEMCRDTIARCISEARQKIGLTEHDLDVLAGIPCDCADCRACIVPQPRSTIQPHQQTFVS